MPGWQGQQFIISRAVHRSRAHLESLGSRLARPQPQARARVGLVLVKASVRDVEPRWHLYQSTLALAL